MKKTLIALATLGLIASGAASADSFILRIDHRDFRAPVESFDFRYQSRDFREHDRRYQPGIDDRQARLGERLQHGVQTGALTRWEARSLFRELAAIEAKERAFEADGRLHGWERAQLNRDLDRVSLHLRAQLGDGERRY